MGYEIDPEYKEQLKRTVEARQKAREAKKKKREEEEEMLNYIDSDETFSFIAGYTSGGAPYGVTWEQYDSERDNDDLEDEKSEYDEYEIPF
ncbi:hypothetical protein GOQ27_12075 [Clostridium sp. D2Q-11]|uniref:Uncharacterized protein n=1 Tax=Anaeromonas frigoriresistens TaxID=2683708 RepID=A0A942UV80_9FIRM|nr:hypothetical protein [Anaeromonas frigoriresistens]MBS4539203.1 hypothetical protein [Anaeromonas frigoriresistens]